MNGYMDTIQKIGCRSSVLNGFTCIQFVSIVSNSDY